MKVRETYSRADGVCYTEVSVYGSEVVTSIELPCVPLNDDDSYYPYTRSAAIAAKEYLEALTRVRVGGIAHLFEEKT